MTHRLDLTRRLHERMLEIVRTGLPLIASSMRDADLEGLACLRDEMVSAVDLYCRHVHAARETARGGDDAGKLAVAELLVAGCASLRAAYDSFRQRWAHRHAVEHWPEYRLSAIVMMKQVRNHIQQAQRIGAGEASLAA